MNALVLQVMRTAFSAACLIKERSHKYYQQFDPRPQFVPSYIDQNVVNLVLRSAGTTRCRCRPTHNLGKHRYPGSKWVFTRPGPRIYVRPRGGPCQTLPVQRAQQASLVSCHRHRWHLTSLLVFLHTPAEENSSFIIRGGGGREKDILLSNFPRKVQLCRLPPW